MKRELTFGPRASSQYRDPQMGMIAIHCPDGIACGIRARNRTYPFPDLALLYHVENDSHWLAPFGISLRCERGQF